MRARRFLAVAVVVGGVLVSLPATAFAQTLVPCNGPALQSAVAATNAAGGGTLNLTPACTYTLTAPDNADNGLAVITTPIRINGNRATITRSSATDFRFFLVNGPGNLTLDALTLANGRTDNGGAIRIGVDGRLTLSTSTVTGNTATVGAGGGIYSFDGTVEVNNSTLGNNTATQGGGFFNIFADATFNGSAVIDNHVIGEAVGGGINNVVGSVILNNTRIADNDATFSGGSGDQSLGAGLANGGTLTLIGSPVINNIANGPDAQGGGVWNIDTLNVTNSPIIGNAVIGTNARGGGIHNGFGTATLQGVSVVTNRAVGSGADGGGIFRADGTVTLSATSVAGNQPNNCGSSSTVSGCS
ncbi:hypothetical protein GCM10010464_41800 [Pseudonocardia yunnanensis]